MTLDYAQREVGSGGSTDFTCSNAQQHHKTQERSTDCHRFCTSQSTSNSPKHLHSKCLCGEAPAVNIERGQCRVLSVSAGDAITWTPASMKQKSLLENNAYPRNGQGPVNFPCLVLFVCLQQTTMTVTRPTQKTLTPAAQTKARTFSTSPRTT